MNDTQQKIHELKAIMELTERKQELLAMSEGAGVFDASHYGHLKVEGADAMAYLQKMTSNDVSKMPVGGGFYNALLDRKGMILSLFYLLRPQDNEFHLITPPQLTQKTAEILNKMKFIQKVTVTSESQGYLLLIGPKAESLLPTLPQEGILLWKETLFGPPLWNLTAPLAWTHDFLAKISPEIPRLSPEAVRLMRMKVGFPEYGVDIDETHNLLELTQPIAYQRNKGCYPGQEVVERILAYGKGKVPKKICRLEVEGKINIEPGMKVVSKEGLDAGAASSSVYDPVGNKTILLACLTGKYADKASQIHLSEGKLII